MNLIQIILPWWEIRRLKKELKRQRERCDELEREMSNKSQHIRKLGTVIALRSGIAILFMLCVPIHAQPTVRTFTTTNYIGFDPLFFQTNGGPNNAVITITNIPSNFFNLGDFLTNNRTIPTTFSNNVSVDAAHYFYPSNVTASRVVLTGTSQSLTNATASGAVPINADGTASTFAQVAALGNFLTNNETLSTVFSNKLAVDAAHAFYPSNATVSRVAMIGSDNSVTNASATSAASPINRDGSATTFAQIASLGNFLTNNESLATVFSNTLAVDISNAFYPSNATVNRMAMIGADNTVTNASATATASPINRNGTATTGAQIQTLLGGAPLLTGSTLTRAWQIQRQTAQAGITNVTSGLNNWWPLMEGGGTTAADIIGAANGTLTTSGSVIPAWSVGVMDNNNYSLTFDGVSSYLSLAGDTVSGAYTFSVWFSPAFSFGVQYVLADTDFSHLGYEIFINGSQDVVVDARTTLLSVNHTSTAIPTGLWTHLVVTWDGSLTAANIHIYTNGVETGYSSSQNGTGVFSPNNTGGAAIGAAGNLGSGFFSGKMADARLFSRVVSATEISMLYNWSAYPFVISATTITNLASAGSRVQTTDSNGHIVDSAASGAVPVNANGTASTFAQIAALGPFLTNNETVATVFSNNIAVDAAHEMIISNATASRLAMIRVDNGLTNASVTSSANTLVAADGSGITAGGANVLLHGTSPPAYSAVVEGDQSLSDVTTKNASTSAHGYEAKLPGTISQYADGNGTFSNGSALTNNATWQTADYNALISDTFILLSGAHKVTLPSPSAVGQSGKLLWIQCSSAGTNAILPNAAETFSGNQGQGLAKLTNTTVGKATLLWSNRTNWWYVQL